MTHPGQVLEHVVHKVGAFCDMLDRSLLLAILTDLRTKNCDFRENHCYDPFLL
jgi:hypothetical protein